MLKKRYPIAALAATLAAAGAMSVAAAPASAFTPCQPGESGFECFPLKFPFLGWHVTGNLTTGGQKITLPPGGTFTGAAVIAVRPPKFGTKEFLTAEFAGQVVIPPFTQEVEFPAKSGEHQIAGMTITETPVKNLTGFFESTLPVGAGCPNPVLGEPKDCVNEQIFLKLALGYSVVGPGAGLASKTVSHCETAEPVNLHLSVNLTFLESAAIGARYTGTTTVPSITCSGKYGVARGNQLTEAFSGPAMYELEVRPPHPL